MAEKLDRQTLLDTIKKLLNVQVDRGATPAEAASAAAAAQRMCAKHGLSMLEVESHRLKEQGFGVVDEKHESYYKDMPNWTMRLLTEVGRAFDCKMFLDWTQATDTRFGRNGIRRLVHFVGLEVDAVVARYLYVRLENELYGMGTETAKREGYSGARINKFRANFIEGAADVIGQRLREQREELKKTEPKYGALIVVKKDVVNREYDRMFPNRKNITIYRNKGTGYHQGQEAGRNLDLKLNRLDGGHDSAPAGHIG